MRRVLLTGVPGAGKSSVVAALAARGHRAVDADCGGPSWRGPGGDRAWREDRIRRLVVLFSAPASVVAGHLGARTSNPHGKSPAEPALVQEQPRTVGPLLTPRPGGTPPTTSMAMDV